MEDYQIYVSIAEGQIVLNISELFTEIKANWKIILEDGFLCCYCKKTGFRPPPKKKRRKPKITLAEIF